MGVIMEYDHSMVPGHLKKIDTTYSVIHHILIYQQFCKF